MTTAMLNLDPVQGHRVGQAVIVRAPVPGGLLAGAREVAEVRPDDRDLVSSAEDPTLHLRGPRREVEHLTRPRRLISDPSLALDQRDLRDV